MKLALKTRTSLEINSSVAAMGKIGEDQVYLDLPQLEPQNQGEARFSWISLDFTQRHFSIKRVFASPNQTPWSSLNPKLNFCRDRGVPVRFISPIADQWQH